MNMFARHALISALCAGVLLNVILVFVDFGLISAVHALKLLLLVNRAQNLA
jgi:hypothetical protein